MDTLFSLSDRPGRLSRKRRMAQVGGRYRCRCGRPIFFRNSRCLGCGAELGLETTRLRLFALAPGRSPGTWRISGSGTRSRLYRRCANYESPAGCNWLVPISEQEELCVACRLNRTIPDLSVPENAEWWRRIEIAKRRLVTQLLTLGLPVMPRTGEDAERGIAFDFLRQVEGEPPVMTGHASGVITLNVEEADDARREAIRGAMNEPYRTLLGHLRHEIGHYYWDRLVHGTPWLEDFRRLFGDERQDYAEALKRNYEQGPPADWRSHYVSTYAASHPWEDWAETWAHYLHMADTVHTAIGFGLDTSHMESEIEPFGPEALFVQDHPQAQRFLDFLNAWVELTTVFNELSRCMGQPDFYPFVLPAPAVAKLHFIDLVVRSQQDESA
ncbi:putative zinc-binding peptidase [Niveibacterium sp. SC-1]|uniref:zinc-binding metallopeptidase family protein n=1 Tax=Niveibacterium sp. SC-1 TaxID=3135646 RepID=UPI00311D8B11